MGSDAVEREAFEAWCRSWGEGDFVVEYSDQLKQTAWEAWQAARRELLARQVPEWRTIDSAPRDGNTVLLWAPTTFGKWNAALPFSGMWLGSAWCVFNGDEAVQRAEPTHWQPLPAPPRAGDAAKDLP